MAGICHRVSARRISCCLNGLSGKRNIRDPDTIHQLAHHAHSMTGRRLRHAVLVAGTPEELAEKERKDAGKMYWKEMAETAACPEAHPIPF